MNKSVWLIGAGGMAVDYAKVLKKIGLNFLTIGRGQKSAKEFQDAIGCQVILGGLTSYLTERPPLPTHAIVAVGIEMLCETTLQLLDYGVENILVEKPAGLCSQEVETIHKKALIKNAKVFVAYNRRFYASVLRAREIIANDGGVISFNFEFTEWAHEIEKLKKTKAIKEKWFLANSTHVVDLAFYICGKPKRIACFTSGSLDWHPASSVFSGAGISDGGALFSYQANWESAGRWGVEILTKKHRLILRPMEKLQIQKKGSTEIVHAHCDYDYDETFKPGLFLQSKNFLENISSGMCSIKDQAKIMNTYNQIAAYK